MDTDWLSLSPNQWEQNQSFRRTKAVVSELAVVNDAAERGVKDVQEYANAARDGEHRGNIVLVANRHRQKLPRFVKGEMEKHAL